MFRVIMAIKVGYAKPGFLYIRHPPAEKWRAVCGVPTTHRVRWEARSSLSVWGTRASRSFLTLPLIRLVRLMETAGTAVPVFARYHAG